MPEPKRRLTPAERAAKEEEARRLAERRARELAAARGPPRVLPADAGAEVRTADPRKAAADARAAKRDEALALKERRAKELARAVALQKARGVMHRDDLYGKASAPTVSDRLRELFGDKGAAELNKPSRSKARRR